jgi:hypothetical protein
LLVGVDIFATEKYSLEEIDMVLGAMFFQVVKGDSGKDSEREVRGLTFCVLRFLVPRNGTFLSQSKTAYLSAS